MRASRESHPPQTVPAKKRSGLRADSGRHRQAEGCGEGALRLRGRPAPARAGCAALPSPRAQPEGRRRREGRGGEAARGELGGQVRDEFRRDELSQHLRRREERSRSAVRPEILPDRSDLKPSSPGCTPFQRHEVQRGAVPPEPPRRLARAAAAPCPSPPQPPEREGTRAAKEGWAARDVSARKRTRHCPTSKRRPPRASKFALTHQRRGRVRRNYASAQRMERFEVGRGAAPSSEPRRPWRARSPALGPSRAQRGVGSGESKGPQGGHEDSDAERRSHSTTPEREAERSGREAVREKFWKLLTLTSPPERPTTPSR